VLAPDAPLELRDRGLLYARLECWSAAASDLQRFLALSPNDPTAPGVRQQLVELMRTSPPLN
jgi:regulator of sirC expression with transglutaminase-like and TPR domain